MRELRIYDPARRPPDWGGHVRPTDYAVFFTHSGSDIPLDATANPYSTAAACTCYVFDTFDEACAFAREASHQHPQLRGLVFDAAGRAKPPLFVAEHPSVARRHEASPRTLAWSIAFGIALIVGAVVLLVIDARSRWALILPTILAVNMILGALRLWHWIFSSLEVQRTRRREAARHSAAG